MKRFYIPIVIAAAMLFSSCERSSEQNYTYEDPWAIFLGYMQFSTKVQAEADTRAALATNMRSKQFGVFGYSYSSTTNWDTAKALATPDTFHNQLVTCDTDGICKYDINGDTAENELEKWEEGKHYSFFAYHPYNGNGIELSGATAVNTPLLTYKYAWADEVANSADSPIAVCEEEYNDVFDLMTAEYIDADGSGTVNFNFKHRLFAVEVLANNYNENIYEYDEVPVYDKDANGNFILDADGNKIQSTDADGNPIFEQVVRTDSDGNKIIAEGGSARQTISNLKLKVTNLANSKMVVPLSMRSGENVVIDSEDPENKSLDPVTFQLSKTEVTVPAFNETITDPDGSVRGGGVATSISKLGSAGNKGYLMFIPQSQGLHFEITWDEMPKAGDNTELKNTLDSNMEFKAGTLYQLIINFVGSGITITLIEAGKWDVNDVKYTFE